MGKGTPYSGSLLGGLPPEGDRLLLFASHSLRCSMEAGLGPWALWLIRPRELLRLLLPRCGGVVYLTTAGTGSSVSSSLDSLSGMVSLSLRIRTSCWAWV